MSLLTGATYRIGYNKRYEGFLNTHTLLLNKKDHEVNRNLKLVQPLGISQKRESLITVTEKERKVAKSFISMHVPSDQRLLLGIHPGCNNRNRVKRWLPERFAEVGDWFIRECEGNVLLFGGPDEEDVVLNIKQQMKISPLEIVNCPLRETVALINECHLFLSNDSGLMHIADSLRIPVVSIFGPSSIEKSGPLNNMENILFKNNCSQSCQRFPPISCRYSFPPCLESISITEVKDKITALIPAEKRSWIRSHISRTDEHKSPVIS
jgi:heptosyltransferase-2